jgi:ribosome-binding protein aMBF1 (putative translation factor)
MNKPRKHTSNVRERLKFSGDRVRRARLPKKMMIAAKISAAIETLDWDNKDLAEKLGKYSSEITRWLKGDHNFTLDTLSDIEEILDIKLLALDDEEIESELDSKNILTANAGMGNVVFVDFRNQGQDAGGMKIKFAHE